MDETSQQDLGNEEAFISNEEAVKKIEADNELDYYTQLRKKNKGFLVDGLSEEEQERVGLYITDLYNKAQPRHKELCDKLDEYDAVYRMLRKQVIGDDGDMPNYRSPLSTVAVDTTHANIMNTFHSPKDPIRVLPTEPNDISKINKLSIFINWSIKNELDFFVNTDRLFHSSIKNGETPYVVSWVKEYGTEIKRKILMNPADPKEPLYDADTGDVLYQEVDETKLLYNGPRLDVRSRKDYIIPENAVMGVTPDWEMLIDRFSYDDILKDMKSGKMYDGCLDKIRDWGHSDKQENNKDSYDGDNLPLGEWEKEFISFYGNLRVNVIKKSFSPIEAKDITELEDEFIAIVHIKTSTLCALRKNKFPLKQRPIGVDYYMPDDEGRRAGNGVIAMNEHLQKCYDALLNQFILAVENSNSPFGFFTPTGNMRNEPMKIKHGYMYPTSDASSVNMVKLPPPDQAITLAMQLVNNWTQLLFGISDYAAGMDSTVDPRAPAKKAEIIVQQGNVRTNLIIKRKNETIKDICRRWYLLYRDNMPPNKYMRIVGDSQEEPFKFEPINIEDFQLKSIPDFELTSNVLSTNKSLQVNTWIATYQLLMQNPLYSPQTLKGIQAIHALTKWLLERIDDTGLSRMLPKMPGENIMTPEEENARFLQGDTGEPLQEEDHVDHIKKHTEFMQDSLTPLEIKQTVAEHIAKHVEMLRQQVTQQQVMNMNGAGAPTAANAPQGGLNAQQNGTAPSVAGVSSPTVLPKRSGSVGGIAGRIPDMQGQLPT